MSGERVERRLAAILAVDVAGYSRLMGEDEEGTLATLRAVRRKLGDPKITGYRGRIVTGDRRPAMAFSSNSPVSFDAVRCAVEVQCEMATAMPPCRPHGGSNFAWASMSATSSSKTATLWRWRQHRRAPGGTGRAGRDLHQCRGARAGARQARFFVRGHGRAAGQEHRSAGADAFAARPDRPASGPHADATPRSSNGAADASRKAVDCSAAVPEPKRRP